jgi:hypothetical protein
MRLRIIATYLASLIACHLILIMRPLARLVILTLLVSLYWSVPMFAGKVEAFAGKDADFSRYKTFQWLPPRVLTKLGVVEDDPANPFLKAAVGRQLSQKGLNELANGADLQIQAWVLTEQVPQFVAMIAASVSIDLSNSVVTVSDPMTVVGQFNRQGSLYLNLIDSRTNKSAWFAMVSDSLPNRTLRPDEMRAKLDKAAKNIFNKYPVKK